MSESGALATLLTLDACKPDLSVLFVKLRKRMLKRSFYSCVTLFAEPFQGLQVVRWYLGLARCCYTLYHRKHGLSQLHLHLQQDFNRTMS